MKNWTEQLQEIVNEFKDGDTTPLNVDEVEVLMKIIRAKINFSEGNITEEECDKQIDNSYLIK